MKWLVAGLVVILLGLQYRLWVGDGSVADNLALRKDATRQREDNARLQERNKLLQAEVEALKTGYDAIEEKARYDMGMIGEGETFFFIVEEKPERISETP